jgi:ribonuclease P protein component
MVTGCLIANWRVLTPTQTSRLGVITSGRIGNAVIRSRARRLLREAFRLHQTELKAAVDLVLIARNSIVRKALRDVEKDLLTILRKAGLSKEA